MRRITPVSSTQPAPPASELVRRKLKESRRRPRQPADGRRDDAADALFEDMKRTISKKGRKMNAMNAVYTGRARLGGQCHCRDRRYCRYT
jgi:hypothetical protein